MSSLRMIGAGWCGRVGGKGQVTGDCSVTAPGPAGSGASVDIAVEVAPQNLRMPA